MSMAILRFYFTYIAFVVQTADSSSIEPPAKAGADEEISMHHCQSTSPHLVRSSLAGDWGEGYYLHCGSSLGRGSRDDENWGSQLKIV
ncbi:hypothetical protein BX600DRAFT_473871 [Xylariales sp. PMI_506]|nr:hypothetical protein BX600DRAFT_473871 [Xylariales sp. PMI_506]